MDTLEALRTRRTTQNYQPSEIPQETLLTALETALYAPNHRFTFPWHFVIVGRETRQQLKEQAKQAKLQARHSPATPEEEAKIDQQLSEKILFPAALVAFCCAQSKDPIRQREDYATLACSIQNFCLALHAMGYGSKWGTGDLTTSPATYQLLGIEREHHEIIGFVWIGEPEGPLPPQKRPSLHEVLRVLP